MNDWNKETLKIVLILLIIIGVVVSGYFMYKSGELIYYNSEADINNVLNKKWFSISNRDIYEMIEFTSSKRINYVYYDKIDNIGPFSGCSSFIYSYNNKEFNALCEHNSQIKVEILDFNDDRLVLLVDKSKRIYYSNIYKVIE